MKKLISLFVLALVVAALPAMLVGCSKSKTDKIKETLIGTWVYDYSAYDEYDSGDTWQKSKDKATYIFETNGKVKVSYDGKPFSEYDWSIDGEVISISWKNDDTETFWLKDGDKLVNFGHKDGGHYEFHIYKKVN